MPALDLRYKKRLPCRLELAGGSHRGMVLNVSRGGLFVQTTAGAYPGDAVHLDLSVGDADLPVDASVVWRRVVAPHLRTVSTGGIGLHIRHASDAWYGFLAGLAGSAAPETGSAPLPAYRVRLRLADSVRTRTLVVAAADEQEARQRALEALSGAWAVIELVQLARS